MAGLSLKDLGFDPISNLLCLLSLVVIMSRVLRLSVYVSLRHNQGTVFVGEDPAQTSLSSVLIYIHTCSSLVNSRLVA